MIFAEPTPFGAGLTLWGDYHDFRSLYQTIDKAVAAAPHSIGDFIVALNYDVRHAYEGQREEKRFGRDELDSVTYRGEKILWPEIMFQTRLVRAYLAYTPTTSEDQSNVFRLEYAVGQALRSFDATTGGICAEWLEHPVTLPTDYLTEFIGEATLRYVMEAKSGKQRFRRLPATLSSLLPVSVEYRDFAAQMRKLAEEEGCDPGQLRSEPEEWPEFKW